MQKSRFTSVNDFLLLFEVISL